MDLTPGQIKAGRRWAYVVMLTMLAISVAGNLSHTFLINPLAGSRAQAGAVIWPLSVWAGVELFVRIPWERKNPVHQAVRWVGVAIPAGVAGLVSYNHLSGLLKADREDWVVYTLGPLAVDGLMLMSTLGLLLTRSVAAKAPAAKEQPEITPLISEEQFRQNMAELEAQLPEPAPVVAPVEVTPGPDTFVMPPAQPLSGWTPPASKGVGRGRAPKYDVAKAKAQIHAGVPKAEIAGVAGVDPKTIQRLRAAMIKAGELTA